ncbi:hypothetical protein Taro_031760 [Colocasia esculenta]|uniref:Uncharacterized protein n=1 Tax=Colocasia esculenta TaxID=4460 RepID=A0A843W434_COLES|nr:hypothetical protein [Colocasia esculenta]
MGRLQPFCESENLLGTLWERFSEQVTHAGARTCCSVTLRVVSCSGVTVPVRKPFIAVRYAAAEPDSFRSRESHNGGL